MKRASLRAKLSQEEEEARTKKLELFLKAMRAAFHQVRAPCLPVRHADLAAQIATDDRSEKAWEVNTRLLAANPDDYELWTYRRKGLLSQWDAADALE
jgi:hypothetical protein